MIDSMRGKLCINSIRYCLLVYCIFVNMETLTIRIQNPKALKLLKDLEALSLLEKIVGKIRPEKESAGTNGRTADDFSSLLMTG